jgi:hypothetical protein
MKELLKNKVDTDKLINELAKYGYDMFVKDNTITILCDGYVKTTPLDNTLNLLYDELMPMTIKDVVELLIDQHKTRRDIDEGKYDNLESMTSEETHDKLSEIFEKVKTNNRIKKLYIYREWCNYHVGFYDDKICIASNIDEACEIISKNMNAKYVNYIDGINIIKKEINEFDLDIGFKKFCNKNVD